MAMGGENKKIEKRNYMREKYELGEVSRMI